MPLKLRRDDKKLWGTQKKIFLIIKFCWLLTVDNENDDGDDDTRSKKEAKQKFDYISEPFNSRWPFREHSRYGNSVNISTTDFRWAKKEKWRKKVKSTTFKKEVNDFFLCLKQLNTLPKRTVNICKYKAIHSMYWG